MATTKRKRASPLTSREKARTYRARKRAQGMRLMQRWIVDTRSPAFRAEARRQCLLANQSPHAEEDQAFIESIQEFTSE